MLPTVNLAMECMLGGKGNGGISESESLPLDWDLCRKPLSVDICLPNTLLRFTWQGLTNREILA